MGEAEEGVCDCEFGGCDGAVYEWGIVFWQVSERRIVQNPISQSGFRLRVASLSEGARSAGF